MTTYDYDLFVIGGGSGGVRAARVAASLGKNVAIAEEYRYGGTCVIRGCVPKKLMVYASHFHESFEDAAGFGWSVGETSFDWSKLIANKDSEIDRLEGLYKKGLDNAGAEIFQSRAVIEGPHEVCIVDEARTVTAERIIVATGGMASTHDGLKGGDLAITSNEVFHLEKQPKSVVIAGGGYIAVEFACIFAGLGTQTTLVYRGDEVLRGFDDDIRTAVHAEMEKKGVRIICGTVFAGIDEKEDGMRHLTLSDGEVIEAEQIMFAIGRKPNTYGMGLEKAGVELAASGAIKVDAFSKTNVNSIWALGDVTNRVNLTPVAIHEAMCFIETEYKGNPTSPDHALIPTAVFTHPEIGTIGMTEAEAASKFDLLNVFLANFRPMKHTLSGRDERMLMKLIVDADSDRVVGVHIMGEGAGEMAQTLGVAIKMGATKADFDGTMAVHPTASEEMVTMYQPSYTVQNGEKVDY